ncbi:hypothetical protein [Streptomyces californicus]|uniref:hypothetical protein n=1 Tax=Streptomyces californicus TaxID=67351 RepID=UPI0037248967
MLHTDPPEGHPESITARRATWTRQQHTCSETQAAAERHLREPEENAADGRQALKMLQGHFPRGTTTRGVPFSGCGEYLPHWDHD